MCNTPNLRDAVHCAACGIGLHTVEQEAVRARVTVGERDATRRLALAPMRSPVPPNRSFEPGVGPEPALAPLVPGPVPLGAGHVPTGQVPSQVPSQILGAQLPASTHSTGPVGPPPVAPAHVPSGQPAGGPVVSAGHPASVGGLPAGVPIGPVPMGQVPSGHVPLGPVPSGQVPMGLVTPGQVPAGQLPGGPATGPLGPPGGHGPVHAAATPDNSMWARVLRWAGLRG